ncbi:MAG: zinc-finger domain-containing protein [Micavibrio aeruginosavorus]|uniref:Zinc-finger domain-containing protein n=1 Tax=Micavibrio aeruginosavorus TaxID=349221 RepID=A0A2W5FN36_9BACT|nr:MAG: zinc-finger domain-containing protein [Micavibrio aeruginosavorus]
MNEKPALAPAPEIIAVDDHADQVACDGGGSLGHPLVYYTFDGKDRVDCGYCDRAFIKNRALPAR